MRESAATKANRLLAEGRLIVTSVLPNSVRATCRGAGAIWHLGFEHGGWFCTCPTRNDRCSHLIALRRVVAVDLGDRRG